MPDFDPIEQKKVVKEAISEWLDKEFQELGKWTLKGIAAAALAALAYFVLISGGWHK